ncbi:MAG: hypothetical protein Q9216_002788 [Gyalolechia sp. 2 TL-2023]
MQNAPSNGEADSSAVCARCQQSNVAIMLNLSRDCFIKYIVTKVNKRLESNKLRAAFKDAPKPLLLPFSFGSSSLALLHILDQQLQYQKNRTGRYPFQIHVLFVDMSAALQCIEYTELWRSLKERFPSHSYATAQIEDVFDLKNFDSLEAAPSFEEQGDDIANPRQKRLEVFLAGLPSATSRVDMIGILRSRIITAFAEENHCESIVYGDSTTRLAERTLTETAKGRGGALPWLTADGHTPHKTKAVYPMRDLLRKEIIAYTAMTDPPLTPLVLEDKPGTTTSVSSKDTTIEELMGQYFASVEQNYPSIVANVVRTSSRLAAPSLDPAEGRLCRVCRVPLAEGTEGLRWSGEQEDPEMPVPQGRSKDFEQCWSHQPLDVRAESSDTEGEVPCGCGPEPSLACDQDLEELDVGKANYEASFTGFPAFGSVGNVKITGDGTVNMGNDEDYAQQRRGKCTLHGAKQCPTKAETERERDTFYYYSPPVQIRRAIPYVQICFSLLAALFLILNAFTFAPLPLGSIKPLGWLADQMRLMSSGLAGHEYGFYPIISDSVWLGGHSEYSVLNEGIPYWLNGLVPLAYGLDDGRLKSQTDQVVSYILDHQQSDGWLGPERPADRDIWARFPLCLGLMQLVEADKSKSAWVLPALYKFIKLMHQMLAHNVGYEQFWGRVRYPDMLITLQWLLEHHPSNNTHELFETMSLLNRRGLRWADYYNRNSYIFQDLDNVRPPITDDSSVFPYVHAVNAAQGK